jgi:hypothetical protein
MAMSFDQLKAAFAKSQGGNTNENTGYWDAFYPFFKADFDQSSEFRFLPDADEDNPRGFVLDNIYHELTINGKKKRIACLKMYGEACPCCEASKHYYDSGDSTLGKAFWRKIDVLASGLVINSPFDYPIDAGKNSARMISLSTKLFGRIESEIANGDFDEVPFAMEGGTNFKIIKTKQGEWADYSNSAFARRSTSIPPQMLEHLELIDLKKYRYAKVERPAMEALIEAFMTGRTYEEGEPAAAPVVAAAVSRVIPKPQADETQQPAAVEQKTETVAEVKATGDGTQSDRVKQLMARALAGRQKAE